MADLGLDIFANIIEAFSGKKKEVSVSPVFRDTNASLNAGSSWILDYTEGTTQKYTYTPFNRAIITNDSSEDLDVYINQRSDVVVKVPSGTVKNLTGFSIYSLKIKNIGSASISAGDITVEVTKVY